MGENTTIMIRESLRGKHPGAAYTYGMLRTMSTPERTTAYDIGGFFRVEHQEVPHKAMPYEFVTRIGAVTMLPVSLEAPEPQAIIIKNKRHYYGTSTNMPAGNIDGGLDRPDSPSDTALRELQEEAGYGYSAGTPAHISMFRLREVSNTIDYPRFFAVMHNVEYIGGERHAAHEEITRQPQSLREYVEPFFSLERGETYPEINAAFAKSAMILGREAIYSWLVNPVGHNAQLVQASFEPWLHYEAA